jgi:hypothetical protein
MYVKTLLGVDLAPDVGLTGHGLRGTMDPTGRDWVVTGIPLTPLTDSGQIDPFQLAQVSVQDMSGIEFAQTLSVVPVSWELRCDFCHHGLPDAPVSVLDAHDQLHGTHLYNPDNQTPVLCGSCHEQPELGLPGSAGVESLSRAMHNAHAPRMMDVVESVPQGNACYACHPGPETQCLRDVHARMQMQCNNCHAPGTDDPEAAMSAIADPGRRPWADLPHCSDCHHRPGYEYEQPNTLYRNSLGHGGVYCEACHNSTHAITPARDKADNAQTFWLQNHLGAIRDCTVCHREEPKGLFRHTYFSASGQD